MNIHEPAEFLRPLCVLPESKCQVEFISRLYFESLVGFRHFQRLFVGRGPVRHWPMETGRGPASPSFVSKPPVAALDESKGFWRHVSVPRRLSPFLELFSQVKNASPILSQFRTSHSNTSQTQIHPNEWFEELIYFNKLWEVESLKWANARR